MKVLVSVVIYQDFEYLDHCLASLTGAVSEAECIFEVIQNGPLLDTSSAARLSETCSRHQAELRIFDKNIGFSGAHNDSAARFLKSDADYFLVLNPDLALAPEAIDYLIESFSLHEHSVAVPLLLRADSEVQPLNPAIIDSAGIVFTSTLRHFDRFAGELLSSKNIESARIDGGTGACLLFSRDGVKELLVEDQSETDLYKVFPQLQEQQSRRVDLFDEGFFAYREDAELSLRAKALGKHYYLESRAIGYHVRRVTPERRSQLSREINRHSVRNRFLLQLLHWSPIRQPETILPGFLLRNLLVIAGVIFSERSSLQGLREFFVLWKRGSHRRSIFYSREKK